jgi:hypothetical protein
MHRETELSLAEQMIAERFDRTIEVLLIALLAFMPLSFGAVHAWSEEIVVITVAAISLVFVLKLVFVRSVSFVWSPAYVFAGAFVFVAVLQLWPLPASLVGTLSPHTVVLRTDLLRDLPNAQEVLSAMPLSLYPHATCHDLRLVVAVAAVFVVVVNVYRRPDQIQRLLAAIAVIGGGIALVALAQDVAGNGMIYGFVPAQDQAHSGTFINHSHYSQFMNLSIGAALGLLLVMLHEVFAEQRVTPREVTDYFRSAEAKKAKLLLAMILLGVVTVFVSLSRGGMIATLIAAAFTTLVLSSQCSLRGRGWIIVLIALGAFSCVLWIGFDQVYDRLATLGDFQSAQCGRWQILKDITLAWTKFPVFGVGLGTHEVVYPMFDRSTIAALAVHAENEYAQAAEETGSVGLLSLILFGVVVWTQYARAVRNNSACIHFAAYGLGFGLLAILIQSLSDFGQHLPANAMLSAVCCGLLVTLGRGHPVLRPCLADDSRPYTQRSVVPGPVCTP